MRTGQHRSDEGASQPELLGERFLAQSKLPADFLDHHREVGRTLVNRFFHVRRFMNSD